MTSLHRILVATSACLLFAWGGDGRATEAARGPAAGTSPSADRPALSEPGLARIDAAFPMSAAAGARYPVQSMSSVSR